MAKRRNIRVHGVRRKEPDLRKLSRALLALAEAQHEAEAQAVHHALTGTDDTPGAKRRSINGTDKE